jgi:hypothetical protein
MFINKKEAFKILSDIKKGTCNGSCRRVWLRNIKYALRSSNPLKLTDQEHEKMTKKIQTINDKYTSKYTLRNSPPYPANKHCGETKRGNDGKKYLSTPDKNKTCRWKLI